LSRQVLTDTINTMKLNPKQEAFCQGVASGLSLTQAYIRAGYSEKGAGQGGERLLKNVEISKRVEELRAKSEAKLNYKRETYLETLRDRFMEMPPELPSTAKYGEMLAKAMGWNEPEKIEVAGAMDINIRIGGH
jgi:phage terminase small subunit